MRSILCAAMLVLSVTAARAENLDVSVVTVKKFTVQDNGGVKMPGGTDSYWDFLEIRNNDKLPAIIVGVEGLALSKGCILTQATKLPISVPYKSTLEFTVRQGCGLSGVAIDLDGGLGGPPAIHQQQYGLTDPLLRLASPVFQAHMQRSN